MRSEASNHRLLTLGWRRIGGRLARERVGPTHAVPPGCILFPGATEAVEVGRYTYVVEAQVAQERYELCLRQSTSDSTSPQVDIAADVLVELGIEHYICKLEPTARSKHTADFGKRLLFFGD